MPSRLRKPSEKAIKTELVLKCGCFRDVGIWTTQKIDDTGNIFATFLLVPGLSPVCCYYFFGICLNATQHKVKVMTMKNCRNWKKPDFQKAVGMCPFEKGEERGKTINNRNTLEYQNSSCTCPKT